MNYGQIRDRALQLINQYTIAGRPVALSYNNQADYVNKIPGLINDGLVHVCTTYKRLRASVPIQDLETKDFGGAVAYVMPDDFWQMSSAGMATFDRNGGLVRWHRYHLLEEKMFVLDGKVPKTLLVEYYRYPELLKANPADDDELDGPIEMQMVLPYYVAAHLVMLDNAFAYSALFNEFEARAMRLMDMPQAEVNVVDDYYDAAEEGDVECL